MTHQLAHLQQQFDEEGRALVIRRYRAPSLRIDPPRLDCAAERGIGRTLALAALAALGLVALATPARSETRNAATYGPPAPPAPAAGERSKAFVYPDRFTLEPDETLEQAQQKVEAKRRCARAWVVAGTAVGTALDVVTTQSNQRAGLRETNPLYGSHASVGEMLLFHALQGGLVYWRVDRQARRNPAAACKTARIYAGAALAPGLINLTVRIAM